MVDERITSNVADIERELQWFKDVLKTRSLINSEKESLYQDVFDVHPPHYNGSISGYARFLNEHHLNFEERFLLVLAMVPHVKPELLDIFMQKNKNTQQVYTEFGGHKGKNHNGFLPTGETFMFILAGNDLQRRFSLYRILGSDHVFSKERILWFEPVEPGEPFLNGALVISREVLDLFTTGQVQKPNFNSEFPAKLLSTKMEWEDLVLNHYTINQIDHIETWLKYNDYLMKSWGMEKKLKPGYKALFYGPPGTGKSLTAALIGKKTGKDVYKIDLSTVVSKFIGETEKNLSKVFDKAEHKDWILFFDEADALFGKRTSVSDAHDRYANQEVSYLLQRIEDYDGLVILASNMKGNIDDAFVRRFNAMIHFPMPKPEERKKLWQNNFPEKCTLEDRIDLDEIARNYDLAGGSIINITHFASLMALKRNSNIIQLRDVVEGIKREYHKGERTM
jgi:hypothetical protein